MAFASTLTIADEVNAAKSFVGIQPPPGQSGSKRIDNSTSAALPTCLVINHNTTGQGVKMADRHFVQFTKTVADTNGDPVTTILNMTLSVPRGAAAGDPDELVGYLINFLIGTDAARTLANLDNLLLGEI
jgi:hypothetical protein